MYQGYKNFVAASEGAVARLTHLQQSMQKKIEAKKVEEK